MIQPDKHMSITIEEADKYLEEHRKCYPNAVYVSDKKQIIANMSMPVCDPLDHPHHWAWMDHESFARLRAGLSAQDPDQMLCSMVRAKESLESCNGKCDHIDGKNYTINNKKYTCVKVLRTSSKWMERVNKIMSQ